MTAFSIAPQAQADLDEIWSYIARHGLPVADRALGAICERFQILARHPLLGQRRDDLRVGLRSFVVGKYVIYYARSADRIRIVRVLHGSRDVLSLFEGDD